MQLDTDTIQGQSNANARRKPLDGRTRESRRLAELIQMFETELGGQLGGLTPTMRLQVERAAALATYAENFRMRALSGDETATVNDLVRLDRLVSDTMRELGLGSGII